MAAKVILITGASSGIGQAAAVRLAKAGFTVYACARRLEKMEALQALGVRVLKMDVSDDVSMVAGVETIIKEQGRLDVLVNNAGYGSYGALEDVPISEGKYQFEVNVFGLVRMTQLVLPHMRANHFGKIINITSIGGKMYEPMGSWYHGTKFAVEGMSDCLRMEVNDFGVDVVVIEPGGIRTEWPEIAREKLLQTSGDTAYHVLAQRGAGVLQAMDGMASDPDVIARVIKKAVLARHPRTRYAAGSWAWLLLSLRNILPDRGYDAVMLFVGRSAGLMNKGKL